MLAAGALHAFSGGKAPGSAQLLFPFTAWLGLVNHGIPIEHRVQTVIEEFAGGFLLGPSGATLLIDRRENQIRVAGAVRISPDDVSGILPDFKSQMEPHGSFRHRSQHGLKRL